MAAPRWLVGAGLLFVVGLAAAQTVYRSVGPDGRVIFSDRPPAAGAVTPASPAAPGGAAPPAAAVPYAVQQVVNRFPVTLYTGTNCAPCDRARQLLISRGVPFSERTVQSNADIEALQRISGDASLPFGTIGGQQLRGFADVEWTQYLDAAGYPRTSQLPANYRPAAPQPLVAVRQAAPTAAEPATASAPPAVAPAPAPAPANPAGITF